jgi:hypothetical protein
MRRDRGYAAAPYEADDAYRRPDGDYAGYDVDDDGYPRRDAGYAGRDVEDLYAHEHSDRGYQARLAEADVDHRGYRSVSDDPPDDRRQKPSDRWEHREKDGEGTARPIFGPGSVTQMRKSARPLGAAKGLWFVFGAAVGIVVAMIWSSVPTVGSLTTLLASFDAPSPPAVADQPAAGDASKAQERMTAFDQTAAAAPSADQGDVGQLIDAFVVSLRNQLPMTVGPGITMAAVTAESNTIALGFTIAQAIAAEDEPKLQSELENRFRTSVCATEPNPTNIHGLNRRGVSFLITYTDILGRNVAGLTVGANYCSSPA